MDRQVVHTDKVPPAKVLLSQAIKAGGWIFASGQLGMNLALTHREIAAQR